MVAIDEGHQPEWLSVVIPVKEEGAYIHRTLEHWVQARSRCGLDVRLYVVDGSSRDDTVEQAGLADVLVTDDVRAWTSIGHARNAGASRSRAELIFHTDADVLVPNLQLFMREVAAAFSDPEVVGVTAPVVAYP